MPAAPIAKGVIIMCAVLIAAGYTVYENREQVKELVDKTRRKISLAMHSFADEIMPSETNRQRQPQAFGPRSDTLRSSRANSRSRRNSTDDTSTLHGDDEKAEGTGRDNYMGDSTIRFRSQRGFDPDPSEMSNNTKNPFDDDNRVIFDAATESAAHLVRRGTSESSATLSAPLSEKQPLEDDTTVEVPQTENNPVQNTSEALPSENVEQETENDSVPFNNQQYWSIQQWTEDISGTDEAAAVESVNDENSNSTAVSVIDSDEDDDLDDRVEVASDIASSMGDSWSEVGSTFSAEDRM